MINNIDDDNHGDSTIKTSKPISLKKTHLLILQTYKNRCCVFKSVYSNHIKMEIIKKKRNERNIMFTK